jgi:hypothetical protein
VLVAGGFSGGSGGFLASAEIFSTATDTFSSAGIGSMSYPRTGAAAAPLPDGKVLVAGGSSGSGTYYDSAEIFDPASNSFSPVANPMTAFREGPAAVPLSDGRVLVAGGWNGANNLSSAEVFTPGSTDTDGTFSPVGFMGTARSFPVAAPLPGGRVLVAGGANSTGGLASAVVFDPATNTFSPTGGMSTARHGAVAAALPDGRVLVAGGNDGSINPFIFSSAEVFDPATNSFSSAGIGSMGVARSTPVAAPLPDGRVLVAGGYNSDALSSAEIFAASNSFTTKVKGKKLLVSVSATGKVDVADAASKALAGATAAKKKKPLLLKPSSASGGPGTITVKLKLTRAAKKKLASKGKLKLRAKVTFTPVGGIANTQTVKLKLKGKKR